MFSWDCLDTFECEFAISSYHVLIISDVRQLTDRKMRSEPGLSFGKIEMMVQISLKRTVERRDFFPRD